jgi:hypothetical protein
MFAIFLAKAFASLPVSTGVSLIGRAIALKLLDVYCATKVIFIFDFQVFRLYNLRICIESTTIYINFSSTLHLHCKSLIFIVVMGEG